MGARLTIVIPTYNRAELLVRAVESVLAQTSDQICIYVSDNASTDDTWQRLQGYSDPRLRLKRRTENTDRTEHGRLILPDIETEFIHTLSDDDFLEPDFAKKTLHMFDKYPDLSFVYTGYFEHYDNEAIQPSVGPEIEGPLDFMLEHYANKRPVAWCTCVCRTAEMKRIGPADEDLIFGDMHYWTKMAFNGPVGCVAEPLSHYTVLRTDGGGQSKESSITEWVRQTKLIQMSVMEMVKLHGADDEYRRKLLHNMVGYSCLSTASQFVWARIAGSTRVDCLKAVPKNLGVQGWTLDSVGRIVAALILSRGSLRQLVHLAARGNNRKFGLDWPRQAPA